MANETIITIIGNLTRDPELRFTSSGDAVCNFTVASTPRTFDKNTNEWVDGEPVFLDCCVWRKHAENVAESLTKGMRVITQGRLKTRTYETREGDRRTAWQLDVDEVGPCLRYATARVEKASQHSSWDTPSSRKSGNPWAAVAPLNNEPEPPRQARRDQITGPKTTTPPQDSFDDIPPF